jgi:hypothetical protein
VDMIFKILLSHNQLRFAFIWKSREKTMFQCLPAYFGCWTAASIFLRTQVETQVSDFGACRLFLYQQCSSSRGVAMRVNALHSALRDSLMFMNSSYYSAWNWESGIATRLLKFSQWRKTTRVFPSRYRARLSSNLAT